MSRSFALIGLLFCSVAIPARSADLALIAWNVESDFPSGSANDPHDGNDPGTIVEQLTELVETHDAQIIGLTEVKPSTFAQFRTGIQNGLDSNVDFVTTGSGGDDSMMIVANADRFDMVESFELHRYEDHVGKRIISTRAPCASDPHSLCDSVTMTTTIWNSLSCSITWRVGTIPCGCLRQRCSESGRTIRRFRWWS
jgi:hypothetical protein